MSPQADLLVNKTLYKLTTFTLNYLPYKFTHELRVYFPLKDDCTPI